MEKNQALFRIYDAIQNSKKRIVLLSVTDRICDLEREIDILCLLQDSYTKHLLANEVMKFSGGTKWIQSKER